MASAYAMCYGVLCRYGRGPAALLCLCCVQQAGVTGLCTSRVCGGTSVAATLLQQAVKPTIALLCGSATC